LTKFPRKVFSSNDLFLSFPPHQCIFCLLSVTPHSLKGSLFSPPELLPYFCPYVCPPFISGGLFQTNARVSNILRTSPVASLSFTPLQLFFFLSPFPSLSGLNIISKRLIFLWIFQFSPRSCGTPRIFFFFSFFPTLFLHIEILPFESPAFFFSAVPLPPQPHLFLRDL